MDRPCIETTITDLITRRLRVDFEELALTVFEYQFDRNEAYRRYCIGRGRTPATVHDWHDIPAVPTTAFKIADLTCGPTERVFLTSGTTRGADSRGRHLVSSLALYRAAALAHFEDCVAPEKRRLPLLALTPPPTLMPQSSLAQMIDWLRETYGTDDSAYFVGRDGLDLDGLCAALDTAARSGTPVYLCGVTAAFERLFRHCQNKRWTFRLPYGTVIVDTGGDKSPPAGALRSRPLSRGGFLRACWQVLNVPGYHCVNEYGMTELCSQFYDNVIRERVAGRFTTRRKVGPAWTRTLVVNTETLEEVPPGASGLLRHFDLANCGSVMAVQTEDIGVATGDGFEIHGRVKGAEPRGCALILDDIERANAGTNVLSTRPR